MLIRTRLKLIKKPFEDDNDKDNNDSNDNNKPTSSDTREKEITQSTTDPESGMFYKSEKERCFAYTTIILFWD